MMFFLPFKKIVTLIFQVLLLWMEFKFHWIQILLNIYWEYAHDYGVEKQKLK